MARDSVGGDPAGFRRGLLAVSRASKALRPKRVLLAGVSTRAAAESAARAGFEPTTIDAFVDLDQHPRVRALGSLESYSPNSAALTARGIECDAVVYLAGFENHPGAVKALAANRVLWGNRPEVIRNVRNPEVLARSFHARGYAAPAIYMNDTGEVRSGRWMVKPLAAGGGHGVRPWTRGEPLPRGCYLQEFVDGTPGSVVFVAANGRAVPLGVFRQLIGDRAFGASGYRYCGNILPAQCEEQPFLVEAASALASAATEEFGLVGVNGIDFVERGGVPYPVEVNPRWCASIELAERARGISVFAAHAAACAFGALPEFDPSEPFGGKHVIGKAVVFATADTTVGDVRSWLGERIQLGGDASIRDVPRPGVRIRAGRPICTVFAAGRNADACRAGLVRRAESVYAELGACRDGET